MNLATVIDPHPADAPALVSRGRTTTYGELRAQVAALRSGLVELGVAPGDRVALAFANNWFFVVSYLGALGTGAVVVPLNPAGAPAETGRQLAEVGAKALLAGPGAKASLDGVDLDAVELVLAPEGARIPGARPLEAVFEVGGAVATHPVVERAPGDPALLMFTAGTSGPPRAAVLTHRNLLANIEQASRVPGGALRPDDVVLGVLPLFHIFGLNVVLGQALHAGAPVVLLERFDAVESLEAIRSHGVTVVIGAPPMYVAWATMPGANAAAMRTVRLAVSGAAKLPTDVAVAFAERFGVTVAEGYGLTEAGPVVTSSVGIPPRPGSVGVPLPGVEVRLVDDDGEDALVGDPGEIRVRGPNVFAGYWNDPEATSRVLTRDGWLCTGDVAVADDDGYLYLVDRRKDLVIVSGFNVWPAEVEEVLRAHPRIADVAVVGEPDPYSGEAVKAYVVAVPGRHVDEDELIAFCASRLARYKCPTRVAFVDALPRNATGKALRRALRTDG